MKYSSGDIYEGYFKDGQPHGHGIKKQGDFTSSSATIYTGEWVNGVKQGLCQVHKYSLYIMSL